MSRILPTEHPEHTEDYSVSVCSVCSVGQLSAVLAAPTPLQLICG
jgi:hypothetical protein